MGEFGVYDLDVDDDGGCVITEALAPVNANLALLVAFLVIVVAWILWWAVNRWINVLTRKYGNEILFIKRWAGGSVNKVAKILGWDKAEINEQSGKVRLR